METIKATVTNVDGKHFINISLQEEPVLIPISEDKPNEVKKAFNKLIARIKSGAFQIQLEASGEDLFTQVSKEYISQLNREIVDIHGEMKRLGLIAAAAAK